MIRTEIRDAAVSAAKARAHPEVEERHVLFALARRFRDDPAMTPFFDHARQALEPRGNAYGAPTLTAGAVALLDSITSEEDAAAALRGAFETAADDAGQGGAGAQARAPVEAGSASQAGSESQATAEGADGGAPDGETTGAILAELDALVGLEAVKTQVRSIIAVVQANTEREKAGLEPVSPSLHLVFTGPPGTGKTTVARLLARLYASTGALRGSRFTEASRADLIAGYVGQTAIKTREIIDRTRPGVLFIDEAYALAPKADADFGHEAIATLVKAMEDHRGDLAVIVAGYEDEMAEFVGSNPGLRSRLKTYIEFPDYTPQQLTEIFDRLARASGIGLSDGVLPKAERIFTETAGKAHFGNARFARSLFEQGYARMAARAAEDGTVTVDELTTLIPADIEIDLDTLIRERRRIGF